jgi:hypothetical protein
MAAFPLFSAPFSLGHSSRADGHDERRSIKKSPDWG